MPINPNALGGATPDPESDQPQAAPEPSKRKRRTKEELIADAVVPADDAQVDLKDSSTGAKIQRPWLVAVEMVRESKAEWADKTMKYALLKYDQQKASEEFTAGETQQPGEVGESRIDPDDGNGYILQRVIRHDGDTSTTGARTEVAITDVLGGHERVISAETWSTWSTNDDPAPGDVMETAGEAKSGGGETDTSVPPDAEVGDEVRIGKDVFRVGNGGTLTSGPVSVHGEIVQPKRVWQRELGSGGKGPWEQVALLGSARPEKADTNGSGKDVEPVTIPEGVTVEQISDGAWKIGTGILEKIGLPDYSSLQIGPISASRVAIDDGRRVTVQIGDREASIPAAVVEVAREAMDIVEYIARYQRGELVSFLESTGALRQPVSA
jgi:hypothetical protein